MQTQTQQWEQDAHDLRELIETAGYTQVAAAAELDLSERLLRGFCSGRERVPRAVLYAMRWILEHKPKKGRWFQVHWKMFGLEVKRTDRFTANHRDGRLQVYHKNLLVFDVPVQEAVDRNYISMHLSYTPDRFPIDLEGDEVAKEWARAAASGIG